MICRDVYVSSLWSTFQQMCNTSDDVYLVYILVYVVTVERFPANVYYA